MINPNHPEYLQFPNIEDADEQGFLGHGGDLEINTLLSAYQQGIFPWFSDNDPILWWSPNPRMILATAEIKVSRSLRKVIKSQKFTITCGTAFEQVIDQCSKPRRDTENVTDSTSEESDGDSAETWITQDMKEAYLALHKAGYAQSIECWQDDELVGGLYGVTIAGMYFGESMFSKASNSSKVALVALCEFLQNQGIEWIDCQVESPHLLSLGAKNIERCQFLELIQEKLKQPIKLDWDILSTQKSQL